MKKLLSAILLLLMLIPMAVACTSDDTSNDSAVSNISATEEESEVFVTDTNASAFWKDTYADTASGINAAENVGKLNVFANGTSLGSVTEAEGEDIRYLFAGETHTRAVNLPEGYCLTLPGKNVQADFNLGALRSQYFTEEYCLTLTYENKNPYGKDFYTGNISKDGFDLYTYEWLTEQFGDISFLTANNLRRTRQLIENNTEMLPGYSVTLHSLNINLDMGEIKMPYYNIAIVRPADSYNYFWLFVFKSAEQAHNEFDAMLASFIEIEKQGTAVNAQGAYEKVIPENWSEETKNYYEKLCNQDNVDWGAFYERNDAEYTNWLASEEALDYDMDVYMTYLHMGWGNSDISFNDEIKARAEQFAGGNGFNGKPVLMLTYQWTYTNNAANAYTPMYDILRGKKDTNFRELAQSIKEYGKPVLFRICNEMNTDWTDYCGMLSLADPDIFQMCWERMYNIFLEEGVDNCIWIFNPIATSCPYSNWGEMLCYMPDISCVQMYGITNYAMNNETQLDTFKQMYTYVYDQSKPYFDNLPWCIGEFACGAGGEYIFDWSTNQYVATEKGRNEALQVQWLKGMFESFEKDEEFCKRIKVAVWFSSNDYAVVDGQNVITNYLKLDADIPETLKALREGLAAMKKGEQ